MEKVTLRTLYDMLREGYTVAQLASAIEMHGVQGWDRFGRFDRHKPASSACTQALDALATYQSATEEFWQDLQDNPPRTTEEMGTRASPLDEVSEWVANDLHKFGWPPDQTPAIDRSVLYPNPPRPPKKGSEDESPRNILLMLGAVLDYLDRRPKRISQAQVIDDICATHAGVYGLRKTTLEKWFGQANLALKRETPVRKK